MIKVLFHTKEKRTPERILVVDGNPLIYRAFGVHDTLSTDGKKTGGLYGMVEILVNLIDSSIQPTSVYIVWDDQTPNWRRKICSEYKSGRRAKTPEEFEHKADINRQVTEGVKMMKHLPVRQWQWPGLEADDLAFWITRRMYGGIDRYLNDNIIPPNFTLATIDRDWLQLVRWDVDVYLTDIDETVTVENFRDFDCKQKPRGLSLGDFVRYKCLIGDSSDSLQGIPQIGPKRGLPIIYATQSYDDLIDADDRILKNFELIERNQMLMDLALFPYTKDLDTALSISPLPTVDYDWLYKFFVKNRFLSFIGEWDRLQRIFNTLKV